MKYKLTNVDTYFPESVILHPKVSYLLVASTIEDRGRKVVAHEVMYSVELETVEDLARFIEEIGFQVKISSHGTVVIQILDD